LPGPNSRPSGGNPLIRAAIKFLKKKGKRQGRKDRMSGDRLRHVMRGETHRTNVGTKANPRYEHRGSGYHHRPGGQDYPNRRTTVTNTHPNGVYEGTPEFKNPQPPPPWVPKNGHGNSTFFPDDWSPRKVDNAITEAFKNGTVDADKGIWTGTHDGIKIKGFYDPDTGHVKHGFPDYVANQ
jgi:hypothetical protein